MKTSSSAFYQDSIYNLKLHQRGNLLAPTACQTRMHRSRVSLWRQVGFQEEGTGKPRHEDTFLFPSLTSFLKSLASSLHKLCCLLILPYKLIWSQDCMFLTYIHQRAHRIVLNSQKVLNTCLKIKLEILMSCVMAGGFKGSRPRRQVLFSTCWLSPIQYLHSSAQNRRERRIFRAEKCNRVHMSRECVPRHWHSRRGWTSRLQNSVRYPLANWVNLVLSYFWVPFSV